MRIFSVVQEVLCRSKTQVFCNEIKSDFFLLVKKNGRLIALQICSLLKATSLQEGEFHFNGIILPHIISYDKRFD